MSAREFRTLLGWVRGPTPRAASGHAQRDSRHRVVPYQREGPDGLAAARACRGSWHACAVAVRVLPGEGPHLRRDVWRVLPPAPRAQQGHAVAGRSQRAAAPNGGDVLRFRSGEPSATPADVLAGDSRLRAVPRRLRAVPPGGGPRAEGVR